MLPPFLGSTLHGVLGWALMSRPEAYGYIFENRRLDNGKKDIVNPYLINPPRYHSLYRQGDELRFEVVLLGQATGYARDLIQVLVETGTLKLGAERKPFELMEILHGQQLSPIWQQNQLNMQAAIPTRLTANTKVNATRCTIHLLTPLRVRRGGVLLQELDFATIVRSITKRITEITTRYGGETNRTDIDALLELSSQIQTTSSGLYLCSNSRYSNRRGIQMDMSGLLGAMTFEGDLTAFTPWLHAARMLHIGRNTTFGCGQVDVSYR